MLLTSKGLRPGAMIRNKSSSVPTHLSESTFKPRSETRLGTAAKVVNQRSTTTQKSTHLDSCTLQTDRPRLVLQDTERTVHRSGRKEACESARPAQREPYQLTPRAAININARALDERGSSTQRPCTFRSGAKLLRSRRHISSTPSRCLCLVRAADESIRARVPLRTPFEVLLRKSRSRVTLLRR